MSDTEIPALKPAMTRNEIDCLEGLMAKAETYVEFGCGGSTLLAVRSGAKRIWSVESDAKWISKLRRHPEIKGAEDAGRLTFCLADIGATGPYGYPVVNEKFRMVWPIHLIKWPRYYEGIWKYPGTAAADLFLVDGRFRVACGLAVALHCRPDATVAVHDFTNRPHYAQLLDYFDAVDVARNMQVLRVKPGLDRNAVKAALKRVAYNPD
jgi:hypothetical protein